MPLDDRLARELRNAGKKSKDWTVKRDELIRLAHLDGASYREIAAEVGLSHVGVMKILNRDKEPVTRAERRLAALQDVAESLEARFIEEAERGE